MAAQAQGSRLAELQALETRAREHKAAVRFHRRELRECMDQIAALRALAARVGVAFSTNGVEDTDTHGHRTTHTQLRR